MERRSDVTYRGSEREVIRSGEASLFDEDDGMESLMVLGDETVGALTVGSRDTGAFTGRDIRILEHLASQASVALENARLHASVQTLSLTDPQTGLPNRRHLSLHLKREVAAARRGRALAAVMYDLDNFKQYNDTLGHQAGDDILRAVGRILDGEARSMNLVARYGGDEFVAVLSDTSAEGARIHAERVAERTRTDSALSPHGITVSYGVGVFDPEMAGGSELLRTADEGLYRTKSGRSGDAGSDG